MRLPLIKHLVDFIENSDQDYVQETIEVLEHIIEHPNLKDEELDVIGELLSNLYGSMEVHSAMSSGIDKKKALNDFMNRVSNSIDRN